MGLRLGLGMRLGDAVPLEGQGITRIGIGEDRFDRPDSVLGQLVDGDGALYALVADMVGYNPALVAAIGRPDDGPLSFF